MQRVKGQQHQAGGKLYSNHDSGTKKKKEDGRSLKQRRKDKYAAEAGIKFKPKGNGNGANGSADPTLFGSGTSGFTARSAVNICHCGHCVSCLLEQDKRAEAARREAEYQRRRYY